eukprot:m.37234 g.37234  ORF g.37234 m.37234 type:complete len:825 (-) comp9281_c0_seq1:134-2608(-)
MGASTRATMFLLLALVPLSCSQTNSTISTTSGTTTTTTTGFSLTTTSDSSTTKTRTTQTSSTLSTSKTSVTTSLTSESVTITTSTITTSSSVSNTDTTTITTTTISISVTSSTNTETTITTITSSFTEPTNTTNGSIVDNTNGTNSTSESSMALTTTKPTFAISTEDTTTSQAVTATESSSKKEETEAWVYAVAAVAAIVLLLVLCCLIFLCRKRGKRDVSGRTYSYGKASRIPDFNPDEDQELTFMQQSATLKSAKKGKVENEVESRDRSITAFSRTESDGDYPIKVSEENGVLKVKIVREPGEPLGILTAPRDYARGMAISQVLPKSAAARASVFKTGDLLLSINSRDVLNASHEAVRLALEVCEATQTVEIQVSRQNDFDVKLDATEKMPRESCTDSDISAAASVVENKNFVPTLEPQLERQESQDSLGTFTSENKGAPSSERSITMDEAYPPRRKRTRTIKKEAGRLIIRLGQLVGKEDKDVSYTSLRDALIEEFGHDHFEAQSQYVKNFCKEMGIPEESSTDEPEKEAAPIGRSVRLKSIKMDSMSKYLTMKQGRSATGWFKVELPNGKRVRRYCKMSGPTITIQDKVKKELVTQEKVKITFHSSIQRHGYNLYIVNPEGRWHLIAESEETCSKWYSDLRATFIEICDRLDVSEISPEALADDSAVPPGSEPDKSEMQREDSSSSVSSAMPENYLRAEPSGPPAVAHINDIPENQTPSPEKKKPEDAPAQEVTSGSNDTAKDSSTDPVSTSTDPAPAPAPAPADDTEGMTDEEKKKAAKRAALAAKRAKAKAARANEIEAQLKEIFAWIDALETDDETE